MKINPKSEMLRRAMSDFWWTPDAVNVLDEELATITHSDINERIFNQVIPHGPIPDTQEFIERIRGLQPNASRWVCTEVCDLRLFSHLERNKYQLGEEHGAFVIDVDSLPKKNHAFTLESVKDMKTMKEMYALRIDIFGGIFPRDEQQIELELEQCSTENPKVERFIAKIDGELAGTGSVTYFEELNFAFIWAGGVKEEFRGRGVYTSLLQARAKACKARNINFMGLYARNKTSAPIVAAQGFQKVGTMLSYEKT